MNNLLKILKSIFVKAPLGIIYSIIRLLFLILVLLPTFIARLIECLIKFLKKKNFKEEEKDHECNPPFPEGVMRRPDPCIYDQHYLASQGIPITWNNPDIWFAKAISPDIIETDSYHLRDDTDYIVYVQVHNASTDLALGVKVRLLYRPWSFNSPDLLPVDIDANGNEVVRFINIGSMGLTITKFNWHTPDLLPGETSKHMCLQVHLSHPLDINPLNNIGQENTGIYNSENNFVHAGETFHFAVPLYNRYEKRMLFEFDADSYHIIEDKIELRLKKNTGTEKWSASRKILNFIPTIHSSYSPQGSKENQLLFARRKRYQVTRARYIGYEQYKDSLLKSNFPLPDGFIFIVNENQAVQLDAKETREIPIKIEIPVDAEDGKEFSLNVKAKTNNGQLIGGITLLIKIKN